MHFTLTIKLGNDAMQTPDDIAHALEQVSTALVNNLPQYEAIAEHAGNARGPIWDDNGNRVGHWEVAP